MEPEESKRYFKSVRVFKIRRRPELILGRPYVHYFYHRASQAGSKSLLGQQDEESKEELITGCGRSWLRGNSGTATTSAS